MKEFVIKNKKDILSYIIIILVVVLIRSFLFTPIRVNGSSMNSTLNDGDIMILNKIYLKTNELERFQIVVIKSGNTLLIKRIIGLPGERIKYIDGELYINGKVVDDPYNDGNTSDFSEVYIPKNSYFVMGDNRGNSYDSRMLGSFDIKYVMGTTKLVLFPFKSFGIVK